MNGASQSANDFGYQPTVLQVHVATILELISLINANDPNHLDRKPCSVFRQSNVESSRYYHVHPDVLLILHFFKRFVVKEILTFKLFETTSHRT